MREDQLSCKLFSFRPSTSTFLPAKRNKKGSAHCLFIPANNGKHKGPERLIGCAANGGNKCIKSERSASAVMEQRGERDTRVDGNS